MIQNTLLLYYIWPYSPIVLREILIPTVWEKHPVDVLKTFQKDIRRLTFIGSLQGVNFEPLVQMHFHCVISIFFHQICTWGTKEFIVLCFIVLAIWRNVPKASYKGPKVTSGRCRSREVARASILNIITKHISVKIFSVLVHQMYVLDTKKLVIAYSFSFRETS